MAKIIKLRGAKGETLLLNTARVLQLLDINSPLLDDQREQILELDPEVKTMVKYADGGSGGFAAPFTVLVSLNTVDEIVEIVNAA